MKASRCLLLVAAIFSGSAVTLYAQGTAPPPQAFAMPGEFDSTYPDLPEASWAPALAVSSRYPLIVKVISDQWKYNGGHDYKGKGSLALANGLDHPITYHYRCANSFRPDAEYPARWVKADEKLEILMRKPRSKKVRPCSLTLGG